jgi:hypothetical protein
MGKLVGDEVECRYHGLRSKCTGQCADNPNGSGMIPRGGGAAALICATVGAIGLVSGIPSALKSLQATKPFLILPLA